ncbi:MAG: MarR family winged helix-turn-helix transcriptional regulator [Candidatus Neomarinimicrobiota bacterium]
MRFGELLSSLLINLQSLFKNNIILKGMSFPKAIALLIIPLDGIEMSILSRKLGVDNSTTTRLIIGMENNGLVERIISDKDKRISRVFLTSKGDIVHKEIEIQINIISQDLNGEMQHLDMQNLINVLTELNWAILKKNFN